jgi:hypothetical protein
MALTLPLVIAASFVAAPTSSREWMKDYGAALKTTKQAARPLLIVIDQQPKWLAHVEPASDAGQPVPASLLQKYTLCHVDATTAYGKAVAKAFGTSTFPTTVIIDKSGSVQLVRKTGRLRADALASLLVEHQRGMRPVAAAQPTVCRT